MVMDLIMQQSGASNVIQISLFNSKVNYILRQPTHECIETHFITEL